MAACGLLTKLMMLLHSKASSAVPDTKMLVLSLHRRRPQAKWTAAYACNQGISLTARTTSQAGCRVRESVTM